MTGNEEVSGDAATGCDGEQRGKPRRHLEVFGYVTTPRGKGVVICSRPYLLGAILLLTLLNATVKRIGL